MDITPDAARIHRDQRRKTLERSWVIGVVLFGFVRFVLAWEVLSKYSPATVIIFGLIDFGTAVPYAIGTARLVTSLVDRDGLAAARWGALASACFLAPYLWIAWAGHDHGFPVAVYIVTGVLAVS